LHAYTLEATKDAYAGVLKYIHTLTLDKGKPVVLCHRTFQELAQNHERGGTAAAARRQHDCQQQLRLRHDVTQPVLTAPFLQHLCQFSAFCLLGLEGRKK
jgi:hypothetical protein